MLFKLVNDKALRKKSIMLRFVARGRFVICDNLEKCLNALGGVRDTCSVTTMSRVKERLGGGLTSRSNCLIDSTIPRTAAEATRRKNCRLSSTSTVSEARKTCLYNLHVDKQGKLQIYLSNILD